MRLSRFLLACLPAAALLGAYARPPATTSGNNPTASKLPPSPLPGHYLATPPTIDGRATEWTDSLHYDSNTKLQYLVLNDTRTVYVRLKANDPSTQAKFVYLGMVIWLDSTGRNQQQLGIRYPLPVDLESLPKVGTNRPPGAMAPSAAEQLADHQTRLRQVLLGTHEMELLNFRGNKEPVLTDAESLLGVKAAINLDEQGNLIYELAVPLRLLYRRVPALASGQAATVGVTIAGMKPKMPKSDGANDPNSVMSNGGGMRGGMYGGMGGGMGGGMRGGPQYSFTPLGFKTSAQLLGK